MFFYILKKQLFESSIGVDDFFEKRRKKLYKRLSICPRILSLFTFPFEIDKHYIFTLSKMKTNISKVRGWQKRFPGCFVGG